MKPHAVPPHAAGVMSDPSVLCTHDADSPRPSVASQPSGRSDAPAQYDSAMFEWPSPPFPKTPKRTTVRQAIRTHHRDAAKNFL